MMEPLQETAGLSNDRFGFTLFVSICVHAVIILGVGFGILDQMQDQPTLDITLAQFRSEQAPEQADFLAQENQEGSGTLDEVAAPSTPVEAPFHDDRINDVNPVQQERSRTETQEVPEQNLLTSTAESRLSAQEQPETENTDPASETTPENLEQEELSDTLASLQAQLDMQRQAYAKRPRRHTISSASTQQARDAMYLDAWRKRIEMVGNLNYPEAASNRGIYGNLRLLVALRPDGSVSNIRILRSSGHDILDQAAINIVNLAAPFEPFPDEMRQEVDILEIIRTWQFQQGNSFSSY